MHSPPVRRAFAPLRAFTLLAFGLPAILTAACAGQGSASAPGPQQTIVAQATQITGLQTALAGQSKAAPTVAKAPAFVLPTPLAKIAGIPVSGTMKGAPDAKVTITEYSDYQ